MKYIKTYELYTDKGTGNVIDYEVGDIVTCVKADRFPLILNDKFDSSFLVMVYHPSNPIRFQYLKMILFE